MAALQLELFNKERGELKEQLDLCASQQTSLLEERDELKKKLDDFTSQQTSLSEERDELKKKLDDFIYYSQQQWVYLGGSFYYISSNKRTWQQSRDYCLQKRADLIIVNSKEEQTLTRQWQDNMWIGLTDREKEGTWKWVDGTPLITSYWGINEPNSFGNREEDCGEVRLHKFENNWNDESCDVQRVWICEKKLPQ
ncbi:C-type lectin domain family 4 member M-like isoform X3 [Anabas testudineus]|uniref:C-type lectin domain family 4 member M-like isoform X3 n=1 Tax=Anabas testudineus TaxID=64144 RepID=UPI000E45CE29|nr:C-type lectin domain family 4 member M-like isoform X3 [Anabas testudineus]XP_026215293.1 C-type lectin domain family 4 member M-like isoform X3 [Anabas testudineus]